MVGDLEVEIPALRRSVRAVAVEGEFVLFDAENIFALSIKSMQSPLVEADRKKNV